MFFSRKKDGANNELEGNTSSHPYALPEDQESDEYEIETETKWAFYHALLGKTLEQQLQDLSAWFAKRALQRTTNTNARIQALEQQIFGLRANIRERLEELQNVTSLEKRNEDEITEIQTRIELLNSDFKTLVSELGIAHKNAISDRIKDAKKELSELITMYKELFEQKYGSEVEFKAALSKRKEFVDKLIEDAEKKLRIVQEHLSRFFIFGGSKLSANFITAAGLFSAIAAGWFFSIVSTDLDKQNWLFFGLANLFNYLFLFVEQYGPMDAFKVMLLYFIGMLVIITAFIWFIQYTLHQLREEDRTIEFEFQFSYTSKSKNFFKLKIQSGSALYFWLQMLPWIFISGLILIVLTVGQSVGTPEDQIGELGKRLSGQVIGTILTLICTSIFYLYVSRIIEPRALGDEDDFLLATKKARSNRELIILVSAINVGVLAIVANQVIGSNEPFTKILFAVLCFILLLNLTAFALSYGLRQKGYFITQDQQESKIKYLLNLRTSLSGSTLVGLWINEGMQFDSGFLSIQNDIIELSKEKTRSIQQFEKPRKKYGFWRKDETFPELSAERFSDLTKSSDRESQFFLRNFPELSYKIAKLRNDLNESKRELEASQTRLRALRDGHSDFQIALKDEIRQLKSQITILQKTIFEIQEGTHRYLYKLELERKTLELSRMQGFELGSWTKETLIKGILNETT